MIFKKVLALINKGIIVELNKIIKFQIMDSLTQIVLGASVAEATLGKKIGNKAILYGAIAGTIPDLDIILKFFVDDLSATEMHRGFSHSLLFPFIIAPILGLFLKKDPSKIIKRKLLRLDKIVFFFNYHPSYS